MRVGVVFITAALPQLLTLAQLRGSRAQQSQKSVQKPRPARAARQLPLWLLPARLEVWCPNFFVHCLERLQVAKP